MSRYDRSVGEAANRADETHRRSGTRAATHAGAILAALLGAFGCTRTESASAPSSEPQKSGVLVGAIDEPAAAVVEPNAAPSPSPSPPSAATVRFVGRVAPAEPSGTRFAWSGTSVVARFHGRTVSARLRDDGKNLFQVLVDGVPTSILKVRPNQELYELATDLPDGVHDVTLYKRTEARVGETVFFGFETDGTMLPAPPPSERRIEFIGDSITAGYGNEGPGPACTFVPEQENEYESYAAIASRELGAEHVTVAWAGKSIGEMTTYFQRALPSREDSRWNHAAWTPQVVVLNVGTNNFAQFDPGEPKFVRVYTKLVGQVRHAYPDAFVVCSLGPMLSDAYPLGRNNLTHAKRYMRAVEKKLRDEGFDNFEFLEFPEQNHAHGLGCGFHPSRKTHRLMAERLVALVRKRLSW